jgi:hypothetical protein
VNHRTDSANTLRDVRRVAWITALHDDFNAPRHGAAAISFGNSFSISAEFSFDAQMPFYPGDRIDYYICSHKSSPNCRIAKKRLIK